MVACGLLLAGTSDALADEHAEARSPEPKPDSNRELAFEEFAKDYRCGAEEAANGTDVMSRFRELATAQWRQVFQDPCSGQWQDGWLLDGRKATVTNGPDGMTFTAGPTAGDDSCHAVLWTKECFEGDLKIEYEYTRIDRTVRNVTILYIQATGSGDAEHPKDISAWSALRTVPSMRLYFNHMNTYHISYAAFGQKNGDPEEDYIRARRYMPDAGKGLSGTELKNEYARTGLFKTGVPYRITVIKKGQELFLHIQGDGREKLCHFLGDALPPIVEGRIGLRHMYTRGARYRDFRVYLPAPSPSRYSKAEAESAGPAPIQKTRTPIAIDGILDEPAWKRAEVIEADYVWGKVGRRSTRPQMRVRYTWDDHYLYVGYETFDENVVALGTGEKEGPRDNRREGCAITDPSKKPDVIEFFISFGDLRFFWEVHHNAANQFNDIWCVVVDERWPISKSSRSRHGIQFNHREYIEDDRTAGCRLASAAAPKLKSDGEPSTVNDPSDIDTGYMAELRLPWRGLGAPMDCETWVNAPEEDSPSPPPRKRWAWRMAGREMRILAVVQNGDLEERYHHSSSSKPGGWFHKGAEHYPRYVLRDE